jgi:hypothetical protein
LTTASSLRISTSSTERDSWLAIALVDQYALGLRNHVAKRRDVGPQSPQAVMQVRCGMRSAEEGRRVEGEEGEGHTCSLRLRRRYRYLGPPSGSALQVRLMHQLHASSPPLQPYSSLKQRKHSARPSVSHSPLPTSQQPVSLHLSLLFIPPTPIPIPSPGFPVIHMETYTPAYS